MEPNLFKYIWHHSKREQLLVLLLVLLSLPFYFLSLNLPKLIVNRGIQGEGFEGPGSTQTFLDIDLPWATELFGAPVRVFEGLRLEQPAYLLALSLVFLALVMINGGFKFVINTNKGRLGERMLRRLRYELGDRVLRFPIFAVRRVKQAEMATMIKDEVEPLGGFIGDAFVSPAFLGGQALTAMAFIMVQNFWLGLVAASVVLMQAFLIPKLRRPILRLGRERQLTARQLAGRIGEIVDGAVEVHAHDTSNYERADLATRLGRIFDIRYEIFRRKFFVKFLNNFLAQITPFVFYLFGGLLAIHGQLDIGALVAVIAAYNDLPGPIKELIDWDQQRNDVQIKYEQVIEQFQPALLDPRRQAADHEPVEPLRGEVVVAGVALTDDSEERLVDSVSFTARLNEHLAVIGGSGSGKEYLALMLAGLMAPSAGSIRIGGANLTDLPQAVTGRRMSYVGQDTYLFARSVRDNLLYGLKHRPVLPLPRSGQDAARHAAWLAESRRAGNCTFDPDADWIDYAAAGATGPEDLDEKIRAVLSLVELEDDVDRFGLVGTIDPERYPEVADAILQARAALPARLAADDAQDLVVRFDPDRYNGNATVAENLLFGTPRKPQYAPGALAENPLISEVLYEAGLLEPMLDMGVEIARTMVEIFTELPPGHPFFEQFSFIDADDLPSFRALIAKLDRQGRAALEPDERLRLRRLPFSYIEARHRLGLVDARIESRVVEARQRLAERVAAQEPDAVAFYDPDAYNAAASLQDNILFGRVAYGQAKADETVGRAMTQVLDSLGLRRIVIDVGLGHPVGIAGNRLSPAQRQKVGLARSLLKRPDLLIVNDALAVMDEGAQTRLLVKILQDRRDCGVVWTLQRPSAAEHFDRVIVMHRGRLVEQGSFAELNKPGSALSGMVAAE